MSKEEKKSFGEKMSVCGRFFYNSQTGEVLGRRADSWAKIGLFYLFYYAALAAFFAICLVGFFSTMDSNSPTQKNMYSLIKQNPGMGFRPFHDVVTTLIKYNINVTESYKKYVDNLNEFLKLYKEPAKGERSNCSTGKTDDSTVCEFPLSLLGDKCTPQNGFGYPEGKPCVLLKLNKVYNWRPITYGNMTEDLPKALTKIIDPDYIGITCEGESEADTDAIKHIHFYPRNGFPVVYYPYLNQPGYLAPVVMAQFDVVRGRVLMFWCKAWAKNIKHHRVDLGGSVRFELMVDYKYIENEPIMH